MVAAWALSIFFCLIVYCKILHGNFFDRSVSLAVEICSNRENAMTDFPTGKTKKVTVDCQLPSLKKCRQQTSRASFRRALSPTPATTKTNLAGAWTQGKWQFASDRTPAPSPSGHHAQKLRRVGGCLMPWKAPCPTLPSGQRTSKARAGLRMDQTSQHGTGKYAREAFHYFT